MKSILAALCWALIYVGRALEWWRLYWNTLWFETLPTRHWCSYESPRVPKVHIFTRFGILVDGCFHWLRTVAVWLTVQANRGLPPLGEEYGYLHRLYARKHRRDLARLQRKAA